MNLSPSWIERLARNGFEAVHWSTIGAATAPDVEILTWANEHEFVLITNGLDFSAILAAGAVSGPSVIQLRTQDLLSDAAVSIVAHALDAHRGDIERGALLSIDEGEMRVRMLPLPSRREPHGPGERRAGFCFPGSRFTSSAREAEGTTGLGAVVPPSLAG
jgi:predicted nuclease of predicted toxin-antitoxin system